MSHRIPDADILIHAGDFTRRGTLDEIEAFDSYLASLKNIEHKIVIAGNHEIYLDARFCGKESQRIKARDKLRNCIYLEDDHVELYGYKIYGSPWQPIHVGNAFQLERGSKLRAKWNKIPSDTDILVTHGPPLGYGDRVGSTRNVGCEDLLDEVKNRIKPKYHIFGHIHEGNDNFLII
jgi:Icc-related predicted phosphoesterase